MAIKTFKEIIDSKGYRIDTNDRALFELGDIQSFFGFSKTDCIEFVLYDVNDNQLPQTNYGAVRYLPLTSDNIRDYFLIAEGTVFQKYQFPTEYFIDAERLIREAGYDNGIFKVQITLLNKRVGSEAEFDKLWISEISPSRTEVRLFPHENGSKLNPELKLRYGILLNGGDFREDTIKYAISFVERINPNYVSSFLKSNFGESWFNALLSEYQIKGFDTFITSIHNKFMQSVVYEFTNRISNIDDLNYGKQKNTQESIQLSKEYVKRKCEEILVQVLNKYLLNPVAKYGSKTTSTFESYDAVQTILQTKESDLNIDTNPPIIKEAELIKVKTPTILDEIITTEIKDKDIPRPKEIILADSPIKLDLDVQPIVQVEKPYEIPETEKKGLRKFLKIGRNKQKADDGTVTSSAPSKLLDKIRKKRGDKIGGLFPKSKTNLGIDLNQNNISNNNINLQNEAILGALNTGIISNESNLNSDMTPNNTV